MKKISLFLLSLFIAIPTFSQIQNKFFGATFGVSDISTTYSCMSKYFGKKPSIEAFKFAGFIPLGDVNYAGYKWDAINVHFNVNGKFSEVGFFYNGNYNASSQTILNRYNSLKKELTTKYGNNKNYIPDKNGNSGFYYYDGRYYVSLILRWCINDVRKGKEYTEVQLWYWDEKTKSEPERPRINNAL